MDDITMIQRVEAITQQSRGERKQKMNQCDMTLVSDYFWQLLSFTKGGNS